MFEDMKRVTVVGAGTVGSQIVQLFSQVGKFDVTMVEVKDEFVRKAYEAMRSRLQTYFVNKSKMTESEMEETMARISSTADLAASVKNAEYVLECVVENLEMKKQVFKKVDEKAPPDAILASNTSGLSITELASATKRPQKVVGMHFFNPVAVMKLVEVVKGANTSDETVDVTCHLARKLAKEPIVCRDIGYGFLANRAYGALRSEAVQMVWERVASPEDIDKALKLGYNLPMGPLELGDMIGSWGIGISSESDRIREMGEEKGRLHPLVRLMARAGYIGGPGKKGIYDFWKEVLSKW